MPTLEELGIGFVHFNPLGKGLLRGKIDENTKLDSDNFRNTVPRFSVEKRKANKALVNLLNQFAKQNKATPCTNSVSLVTCTKAVDCSNPQYNETKSECGKHTAIIFEISPQPLGHRVWEQLNQLEEGFLCK